MIEIVLTVCLLSSAGQCKDVALSYVDEEQKSVTPMQCMMFGQIEASRWLEGHPQWRLAKWKCGEVRQTAKI